MAKNMEDRMREIIRSLRTSRQNGMSTAVAIAQSLERRERMRAPTLAHARQRLADKLRIGVGTFENLVRGRVKRIDAEIKRRLDALLVRELEAEIARLTHELSLARQGGAHPACEHVGEIEAHLACARALITGGTP
jgi:hypothetical protein